MPYLGSFRMEFENNIANKKNQRPSICLVAKFGAKLKIFKFGTKKPDLGTFGLEFAKQYYLIFEISTLEFV